MADALTAVLLIAAIGAAGGFGGGIAMAMILVRQIDKRIRDLEQGETP